MTLPSARFLRFFLLLPLAGVAFAAAALAQETPAPAADVGTAAAKPAPLPDHPVWEMRLSDFSDAAYRYAVERMLQ